MKLYLTTAGFVLYVEKLIEIDTLQAVQHYSLVSKLIENNLQKNGVQRQQRLTCKGNLNGSCLDLQW